MEAEDVENGVIVSADATMHWLQLLGFPAMIKGSEFCFWKLRSRWKMFWIWLWNNFQPLNTVHEGHFNGLSKLLSFQEYYVISTAASTVYTHM